ncbi:MAG: response regulator [Acidobacteria bacterium]|nr:response regulator [Acidobacteriota bacterium]
MVVEDDASVLSIVRRALAARGLSVLEASNGADALEVLASHAADLLITDAIMPRMGGVELARHIRSAGNNRPIPLVSGYATGVIEAMKTLDGPIRFLEKPLSPTQVFDAVADLLTN